MDFQYSEEQTLLTESVRRLVEKAYDFEMRKRILATPAGWSSELWTQFAEMGLLAIPLPEAHGGFGGGAVDLMGVMQAFGEALVVEPFVPTVVLGAGVIARAGSPAQQAALLPPVGEGRTRLALAHGEPGQRYAMSAVACSARRDGSGWKLQGRKSVVLGAPAADKLVVSARVSGGPRDPQGIGLFVVDAAARGLTVSRYRTFDDMPAGDLTLDDVHVDAGDLLGDPDAGLAAVQATMDFAGAVLCAEAVGAMEYANAATLEYIKTRKQFGVPIGTFQALQHRMVDVTISAEQARSMAILACTAVNGEVPESERGRRVSAARVRVGDACRHVSQEAIQLHGGMGMTQELKVSHTFRRLTMIARRFGDIDYHLERFSRAA